MILEQTLEKALEMGRNLGAAQIEAFATTTRTLHVGFERMRVTKVENHKDFGVGIRVLVRETGGKSIGSSFAADHRLSALERILKSAVAIAKAKKPEIRDLSFQSRTSKSPITRLVDNNVAEADSSTAVSLVDGMIKNATEDLGIRSVSGEIFFCFFEASLVNSLNVRGKYATSVFAATIWVTAKSSGSIGSAFDSVASRSFDEAGVLESARETSKTALTQVRPKAVRSGRESVILGPEAIEALSSSILSPALRGDLVQKGSSPLRSKLGTRVGSKLLTLVDDGTVPGYTGTKPFDDEGHPIKPTLLVEKGILRSFLYNGHTARGTTNTGNGLRWATPSMMGKYSREPQIFPHNMILRPGRETLDDLINQTKEGIFTKSLIGANTANPTSGYFSVSPDMAYKVVKGRIAHPIGNALLSGNIEDLMRNTIAVGRETKHMISASGDSSFTAPPILVERMSVSG